MCNHYRSQLFLPGFPLKTDEFGQLPRDIYPDRLAPIIRLTDTGEHECVAARWGFPPPPNADARLVTNVRNLTSSWWRPWLVPEHRCLVPFAGFAEPWPGGRDREAWFGLPQGRPAAFAGIWRLWDGTRGLKSAPQIGRHLLFAFLTCKPNGIVSPIHPKAMPVLLASKEEQDAWLSAPAAAVPAIAQPVPDEQLVQLDGPPAGEWTSVA